MKQGRSAFASSGESLPDLGDVEGGSHEYGDEDILGQAAMTEAMFDWCEDEAVVHPLNFELALRDFNTVLGIYHSALRHMVVDLPFEPGDGLIDELRERLGADGD